MSAINRPIEQIRQDLHRYDGPKLREAQRNVQGALSDVPRLMSELCRGLEAVEREMAHREQVVLLEGGSPIDDTELTALRKAAADLKARLKDASGKEQQLRDLSKLIREEVGQRSMEFDRLATQRLRDAWAPETDAQVEDAIEAMAFAIIALSHKQSVNPLIADPHNFVNTVMDRLIQRIKDEASKERLSVREEITRENPRLGQLP